MDRFKLLLEKGYFPQQLPPPFNTSKFALHRNEIYQNISPYKKSGKKKGDCQLPWVKGEPYSQARIGHRRRPLTIPHPINHVCLCKDISDNWKTISYHQRRSNFSLSKTKFDATSERATVFPKLSELRSRRLELSAGYRFILRTDILQCFPTTYTHSIPWALHTKPSAKKNHQAKKIGLFGNRLDYWIRCGQEGQTIGLPIGSDTSHIIFEIIASSIDALIKDSLGKWPKGYRQVDDYFICAETYEEAERILAAIVGAFGEYEYQINPDKTSIIPITEYKDDDWVHRIEAKHISNDRKHQLREITDYFEYIFEISKSYNDETVIKYALKKASTNVIFEENWSLFEAYVARIATIYPNNLETVSQIFITYFTMGYKVSIPIIHRIIHSTILMHAPLNHHSEVAWSLWMAHEFNISLSSKAIKEIEKSTSSVCALLALHLEEKGLTKKKINKKLWRKCFTEDGLKGQNWLLSYQAAKFGWISGVPNSHIKNSKFFNKLNDLNIDFYDISATTDLLITREPISSINAVDVEFDYYDEENEIGYNISEQASDYID